MITATTIIAANIYQVLLVYWGLSSKPYRHYLIEYSQKLYEIGTYYPHFTDEDVKKTNVTASGVCGGN